MIRKCDVCKQEMTSGYVIHEGEEYYCSDDCLYGVYSQEEYIELCESDEAYWTEWDEDIPFYTTEFLED